MKRQVLASLCLGILLLSGCAALRGIDAFGHEQAFDDAQLLYTQYIRWNAFEEASALVEPELRESFLSQTPSLRNLRFSEYTTGPVVLAADHLSATVRVSYRVYDLSSLVEHTVHEEQEWTRTPGTRQWHVRPDLEALGIHIDP